MNFSADKEDLPMGFVLWEVKGFSREHDTPTVISIRKSHWLQKIFEDLVRRLLCFVTLPTEAFPKHSTEHLQEFETRPRLFCFLKSRIYPTSPLPGSLKPGPQSSTMSAANTTQLLPFKARSKNR